MSNQAKRELMLEEWVNGLPEGHRARVELAALKRGIVEYAAMKQYLRAGPDGSTKPMWHDVDEEEKERYRESVRDVLLTAEEQE